MNCNCCTTYNAPDLMDGGVTAALVEKEADDDLLTITRAQRDEARRERDVLRQERDEARRHECSDLDAHWRLDETLASLKEANATVASLRAEQPRSEISSRNVVDFLADSLSNLSDSDRDYLSRILANSGR